MIRLAHCLLAIYTVLLSCIPCQDEEPLTFQNISTGFIHATADQNDQKAIDLCSPFCICACCSAITLHQSVAALPEVQFFGFPENKGFSYAQTANAGNLTTIWQPPRI